MSGEGTVLKNVGRFQRVPLGGSTGGATGLYSKDEQAGNNFGISSGAKKGVRIPKSFRDKQHPSTLGSNSGINPRSGRKQILHRLSGV